MVCVPLPAMDLIVALLPTARNVPSRIATASAVLDCPSMVRILPFTSTSVGTFKSACWAYAVGEMAISARHIIRGRERRSIGMLLFNRRTFIESDQDERDAFH